jgi:serine/threonine protein kinase
MAPEQVKNGMVNERTDIYNFGATMYRLVTLRLPPNSMPNKVQVDSRTLKKLLKPVQECAPDCPAVLCDLIHSCLSHDANRRPERFSEIHGTLDHLADEMVPASQECLEEIEW